MSDVEVRTGVGDAEDAPVGPRDAEGCEARARVFLGGDAQVEVGWGASTWLGPTPAGACWERGATHTRRVNSPPWSIYPTLVLS